MARFMSRLPSITSTTSRTSVTPTRPLRATFSTVPLAEALWRRGLLPDRYRRARLEGAAGGGGEGGVAQGAGGRDGRAFPLHLGRGLDIAYDDFIRTTEPRHYAAVQTFLQKIYDSGDIELGTYEGLYCVSCEAYYSEDELVDGGNCPIHMRPVEHVVEENSTSSSCRFVTDRLLEYYAAYPDVVQPKSRMNEVLGFIRGGLQDFSMSRTSINWAVRFPGIRNTSRTYGPMRCSTTAPWSGTRPTTCVVSGGRSTITSSARTSCAFTRCTGRRCRRPPGARSRRAPRSRTAGCSSAARR